MEREENVKKAGKWGNLTLNSLGFWALSTRRGDQRMGKKSWILSRYSLISSLKQTGSLCTRQQPVRKERKKIIKLSSILSPMSHPSSGSGIGNNYVIKTRGSRDDDTKDRKGKEKRSKFKQMKLHLWFAKNTHQFFYVCVSSLLFCSTHSRCD